VGEGGAARMEGPAVARLGGPGGGGVSREYERERRPARETSGTGGVSAVLHLGTKK